jgi:hypothetical protein
MREVILTLRHRNIRYATRPASQRQGQAGTKRQNRTTKPLLRLSPQPATLRL